MKVSKWFLATALLCSATFATAQGSSCDPCDPCATSNPCDLCDIDFCDVEYDFYVDALYWEVCHGMHRVFVDDGHLKSLDSQYDWGYRIGGNARWKCWDLGLRYTSLCLERSKSFDDGEFEASFEFDYDVLDIEVGYSCCLPCCSMTLRPFVGAKLTWIDDTLKLSANDVFLFFEKSKIDQTGYGLYIGTSARWELCSYCACDREIPIALVARASTGILQNDFEFKIEEGDFFSNYDSVDSHCVYTPVHELDIGLDFTFCDLCGCGDAFFQIGYEVQYWGWPQYDFTTLATHLGMGGLVLRFGAGF